MNHITNDRGETVIACGAPGSIANAQVERPALIEQLNRLYYSAYECHGKCVDKAIELIRGAGIRSELETNSLLAASHYGEERPGSVTSLVMAVARPNRDLFKETFIAALRDCVREFPAEYGFDATLAETVAARMFDAMDRNGANYNSRAYKLTAKRLGIKPTRQAINDFWNS